LFFVDDLFKPSTTDTPRQMSLEEITQHLNKVATLYLKDNKRKVGWIFVEKEITPDEGIQEVSFISIQKGRKLIYALETGDTKVLEPFREIISMEEIERIRSTK
jgi:hypothetical protein